MCRTIAILVIAGAILFCCSGGSVNEEAPDAADWQSFSDEKVLECLDNPVSTVRLYAGQEILRRWDEKKIIAHLKKQGCWRQGLEILYAGAWPGGGSAIEDYLLKGDGFTDSQCEDTVALLSPRGTPDGDRYAGRIGTRVRDEWFSEWIARVPQYIFFSGTLNFICARRWMRERLYVDGAWITSWGATRLLDGKQWWYPWRLVEYRAVVAILCGEPTDEAHVAKNKFLSTLRACVTSGRNEVAASVITSDLPPEMSDALTTSISVSGVGPTTYAELVAVVMDRPDWMPAIHDRLKVAERVWQEPILDPKGKIVGTQRRIIVEDRRSPLMAFAAALANKRWDDAKASLKGYWRKEWAGYAETVWSDDLWTRHPWFATGFLDKDFAAWYGVENKPFADTAPDTAFLKGEWR